MTQQQTALEKNDKGERVPTFFERTEDLFEEFEKNTKKIAQRAFEYFNMRGREFGHELEDWFKAESDIIRQTPVEIVEANGSLGVKAEVPGFTADDLKVIVEPTRLTIKGEHEDKSEKKEAETLYSEWKSNKIFRTFELPKKVEAEKAVATLKDGVLSLSIPKAKDEPPSKVEVRIG